MSFDELQRVAAMASSIETVMDDGAADDVTRRIFEGEGPFTVSFVNAHAMNLAAENAEFWADVKSSNLVLRDGIGIAMLLRLLGKNPGLNMNGTDYIPKLINEGIRRGFRFYLLGTEAPYNAMAADLVRNLGGDVVWVDHGFHPDDYYKQTLDGVLSDHALIILAMGMPKQERIATLIGNAYAERRERIAIINGGAILDFLGGKVNRAPIWIRQIHCEWLYRLMVEPKRLFRRYVIGNIIFLWRSLKVAQQYDGK